MGEDLQICMGLFMVYASLQASGPQWHNETFMVHTNLEADSRVVLQSTFNCDNMSTGTNSSVIPLVKRLARLFSGFFYLYNSMDSFSLSEKGTEKELTNINNSFLINQC